jgi:hypothetical protein
MIAVLGGGGTTAFRETWGFDAPEGLIDYVLPNGETAEETSRDGV